MSQQARPLAGAGFALLSAATFGTSGIFGTALMNAGWSPGAAVTSRVGIAAVVLTAPALVQLRGRWSAMRADRWAVLLYGLFAVAGCQLFFFNAVQHLSVGVALLLEYSGTALVVLWLWATQGQRPSRIAGAGIVSAAAGLVLVLQIWDSHRVSIAGVGWGLGAAVGLAVYFVISARSHAELPPIASAWAGMTLGSVALAVAGALGALPVRASTRPVHLAGHQLSWLVPLAGLSLVAAVIAYSSGIAGARRLGPTVATFLGLTEVLFAVLFAWLLLGQRPAAVQLVGGVFVLAGIALVRLGQPRATAQPTGAGSAEDRSHESVTPIGHGIG